MRNLNIALKVLLALLLTHAAVYSELPQYQNKAVPLRLIFYPIAAALTYLVFRLIFKKRFAREPYPYIIDLCVTFVVTFDLLGNTIGFYDKITWWDDLMHFFLSIPWVIVAGYFIRGKKVPAWAFFATVVAYGACSHIVWEVLEYISFVRTNPVESLSAYQDTIGDLILSLCGTLVGAYVSVKAFLHHKT